MTRIKYNLKGNARKSLAKALSEATGAKMSFLGVPSCNYQVGDYIVDKTGTVSSDGSLTDEEVDSLVSLLDNAGFRPITVEREGALKSPEEADCSAASDSVTETIPDRSEVTAEELIDGDLEQTPVKTDDDSDVFVNVFQTVSEDISEEVTDLSDADPEMKEQIKNLAEELDKKQDREKKEDSSDEENRTDALTDQAVSDISAILLEKVGVTQTLEKDVAKTHVSDLISPDSPREQEQKVQGAVISNNDLKQFSIGDILTFTFPENTLESDGWYRLKSLINSKRSLLEKALKLEKLTVIKHEDTFVFPWCIYDGNTNRVQSNLQLLEAMINMARNAKYINSEEKPIDNEKFAMRIFMVRLNMKGERYKTARKVLMENLSGNSAWKSGKAPRKIEEERGLDSGFFMPANCQILANTAESSVLDRPKEAETQSNTENEGKRDDQEQ